MENNKIIGVIKLYECVTPYSKEKHGKKFVYVAHVGEISNPLNGPIARVCPSETSAHRYLVRLGFEMADPDEWGDIGIHYNHKYVSEDVRTLGNHYQLR